MVYEIRHARARPIPHGKPAGGGRRRRVQATYRLQVPASRVWRAQRSFYSYAYDFRSFSSRLRRISAKAWASLNADSGGDELGALGRTGSDADVGGTVAAGVGSAAICRGARLAVSWRRHRRRHPGLPKSVSTICSRSARSHPDQIVSAGAGVALRRGSTHTVSCVSVLNQKGRWCVGSVHASQPGSDGIGTPSRVILSGVSYDSEGSGPPFPVYDRLLVLEAGDAGDAGEQCTLLLDLDDTSDDIKLAVLDASEPCAFAALPRGCSSTGISKPM